MCPKKDDDDHKNKDDGFEVLKIFGIKLKVKDPKIADLLTTDVKEDILTFRQKVSSGSKEKTESGGITALERIDTVEQFKHEISMIGQKLEFDVGLGGIWRSATGIAIVLRPIFDHLNFEAAEQEVSSLSAQQARITTENAGLFITRDNLGCDILKAAIRSKNLYQLMRVVSYANLLGLLQLKAKGYLKHRQVVTLMVPLDNVDVGELLNIVKAVAAPVTLEEYLTRKKI